MFPPKVCTLVPDYATLYPQNNNLHNHRRARLGMSHSLSTHMQTMPRTLLRISCTADHARQCSWRLREGSKLLLQSIDCLDERHWSAWVPQTFTSFCALSFPCKCSYSPIIVCSLVSHCCQNCSDHFT